MSAGTVHPGARRTHGALEAVERAYVGLGSNLGDRGAHLRAALRRLASLPATRVVAVSRLYETAPVGGPPQGPFLNAVVALRTALAPAALLAAMQAVEVAAGRVRGPERNAPRTLDLDLLLYGDRVVRAPRLEIPHPRLAQRPFVLEPLAELAAAAVHPILRAPIAELAARVRDPAAVRPLAPEEESWPSSP